MRKTNKGSLRLEPLEARQLLTADVDLHHGLLTIDGTNGADQAEVYYQGKNDKYVAVSINGHTERFATSKVNKIEFNGRDGNDTFKNSTDIKSLADGGKGNDVLKGGGGKDVFYGGTGNDELWGGSGEDALYGEQGNDVLVGGFDDDVLDGGSGDDGLIGFDGYDRMNGGSGTDRILTDAQLTAKIDGVKIKTEWHGGECKADSKDAVVRFTNGSDHWTEAELAVVDEAFRQLQDRTGNTRLLKDSDGSQLVFVKDRTLKDGDVGRNDYEIRKEWDPIAFKHVYEKTRRIHIANWNASKADQNEEAMSTIIHEIGHNWDSSHEMYLGGLGEGGLWKKFSNISWKNGTKNQSAQDFARSYGMQDSKEDWSTMWERYFSAGPFSGIAPQSAKFTQKLGVLDAFFEQIGRMS